MYRVLPLETTKTELYLREQRQSGLNLCVLPSELEKHGVISVLLP